MLETYSSVYSLDRHGHGGSRECENGAYNEVNKASNDDGYGNNEAEVDDNDDGKGRREGLGAYVAIMILVMK